MTDIDKLGEEVAALIKGAEKDKAKIAPMLRKVWAELKAKKPVNGVANKSAWAQKHGVTLRYCQYIVKDGSRKNQKKDANSVRPTFLARCADAKKKLAEIQRQLNKPSKYGEILDVKSLYGQIEPTIDAVFQEFLALISPEGYEVIQGDNGWYLSEKETPEEEAEAQEAKKVKRSAAAKKAMATRAANKAASQPAPAAATPVTSLGECESCCDGTLATEVVGVSEWNSDGYKNCAKCADLHRKNDRKYLIRQMGVAKVMGTFYTLETLAKLGGKPMDFGDGDVRTYPTVADYIARLKENFLGNKNYDQMVVVGHIARLENRMQEAEK